MKALTFGSNFKCYNFSLHLNKRSMHRPRSENALLSTLNSTDLSAVSPSYCSIIHTLILFFTLHSIPSHKSLFNKLSNFFRKIIINSCSKIRLSRNSLPINNHRWKFRHISHLLFWVSCEVTGLTNILGSL